MLLVEEAPALRQGGYIIDFCGAGYDVADRMGLLPRVEEVGFHVRGTDAALRLPHVRDFNREVSMRVPSLMSVTAVVLAVLGLLLVARTGDALVALGHPGDPGVVPGWWHAAALARLFGITLVAFAMLLWHVRPLVGAGAERRIGFTLAAGLALVGLLGLAQQIAIFGTSAGWLIVLLPLALALAAGIAGVRAARGAA